MANKTLFENSDKSLKPKYMKIDGLLLPLFPPGRTREALDYKPTSDDVFVATYPKCGTTWMQNIVLYILRKGKELEDHKDFHLLSPFIEGKGKEGIENMPRPGAFKTHFPFTHIPYSPEAKYIYVLRNPKDCCVSMYYHTVRAHHRSYGKATFDDFFEIFMAGEVEYGDYFDHLMSWYPHIKDRNVCFTTYEDMKNDIKGVVLKVAAFLGDEYIDAIEKDDEVLNNILKFSRFDYMKEHLSEIFRHGVGPKRRNNGNSVETNEVRVETNDTKRDDEGNADEIKENGKSPDKPLVKEKSDHLRKGIVGDWENHFSEEQNDRMNKKFTEQTQGTEIYDTYKTYLKI